MKIDEIINERIEGTLTHEMNPRFYRQVLSDLSHSLKGDRRATNALRTIEDLWKKGEKSLGKYKAAIHDFDPIMADNLINFTANINDIKSDI